MHIVILGCGRVGSMLAHRLDGLGHFGWAEDPARFNGVLAAFLARRFVE